MSRTLPVRKYAAFVDQLDSDIKTFLSTPKSNWLDIALKAVDGLAAEELRRLVNLETRRKHGAFFTPNQLASKVVQDFFTDINENLIIYDPACGAGNLLLSILDLINERELNIKSKDFLFGTDIHIEFVEAAKRRLKIKQLLQQSNDKKINNRSRFIVEQCDGFRNNKYYSKATHIFVNPPFNMIPTPKDIKWSRGVVSSAALFLDRIIDHINPGAKIIAILPEVLRCGSRYEAWRGMVLKNCIVEKVGLLGQFDKHADVDVFAIRLTKRNRPINRKSSINKLQPERNANKIIQDKFVVCVGPVVDNRDKHEGRKRGYVISRGLLGWCQKRKVQRTRKHQGRVFRAPFVVIKRTSRMGDNQRAIATIINTPHPVYVDNHLIVLQPKSGSISDCNEALSILKNKKTDNWLNNKIRCRHLTVKIVSKIPIWQ